MNTPHFFGRPSPLLALPRTAGERLRGRVAGKQGRPLAVLALAVALAGVAAVALLAQSGGPPQTAFARAPSGQYAVVARDTGGATLVSVVGVDPEDAPMPIAVVPHLHGFSPRGAVSPSGRQVALITPDGAIAGRAVASLITLDLETGELRRLAEGLAPLQDALWTADSRAVVVTRNVHTGAGALAVAVAQVDLEGGETVLETHTGSVMVAPVGFDAKGRLLAVRLDARGSTLTRDGIAVRWLSAHVTRDWSLSPDGTQLAFVEANTWQGLRYLPRVVAIEGGGSVSAASASTPQALGAAWAPSGGAEFGREPYTPPGSVSAQGMSGFDVPLGYSRDGSSLAVRHWSGASFAEPGTPQLEIVSRLERRPLAGFTRFFGWSAR